MGDDNSAEIVDTNTTQRIDTRLIEGVMLTAFQNSHVRTQYELLMKSNTVKSMLIFTTEQKEIEKPA